MGVLQNLTAKWLNRKADHTASNGLYVSLDELMSLRRYARCLTTTRTRRSYTDNVGDLRSAFKGRGIEMEEIREYGFGDDVRDIDWRVTARKEKPYTKIYAEERDYEIWVWLDLSPRMLFGSKTELKSVTAAKTAALLGWESLHDHARFGCLIFDGRAIHVFKPQNDRRNIMAILQKIAEISKTALTNPTDDPALRLKALHRLNSLVKNQAGVFILSALTDWNDSYTTALSALAKKTRLYAVNFSDELEKKAPPAGQYMVEYNGDKLVFDSSSKSYRQAYEDYFAKKIEEKETLFRRIGGHWLDFSAEDGLLKCLKIF